MNKNFGRWNRWLHLYLSMFSFAALLFFAFTGITLNHTDWIEGREKVEQVEGDLSLKWVGSNSPKVEDLKVVEYIRNTHNIRSPLSDFTTDDSECSFSFKGPGYNADGFIDRSDGHYELTITKYGAVAIMNDLHKARDTGKTWAWFIDVSALLMILVSLTGFLMIFQMKNKVINALLVIALGTIVILVIFYFFV